MSPATTLTDDGATAAVLASADRLFFGAGVAATSMGDIRDHSGIAFRRIYRLYPTKSDLVASWLRYRHEGWMRWFESATAAEVAKGASPIEAVFVALRQWLTETDFRGCGFLNTLAEGSGLTDEHRTIIREHKRALVDVLAGAGSDPAALAVLVDGAIVRSAAEGSSAPVDDAERAAMALGRAPDRAPSPRHDSATDRNEERDHR